MAGIVAVMSRRLASEAVMAPLGHEDRHRPRSAYTKSNLGRIFPRSIVARSHYASGMPGTTADTPVHPPAQHATVHIALTVNGDRVDMTIDPRVTLLDLLREQLQLTGTKKGCNFGECGACTVHLDGRRVNACLVLAAQTDGRTVTTIEGVADGDTLHPVQQAFIACDSFQCGFCTPGQVMSAIGCITEGHTKSDAEIREWMSGNLCRCGAYDHIVAAIQDTAQVTGSVRGG